MIAVRLLRNGALVREQVCPGLPVRLGRGPENDVVLFDATVSRAHAVVEAEASGGLVVRDLGSRNGIHVGPRAVGEAHGRRVRCFLGAVEVEVERLSPDDTLPLALHDRGVFEHRRTAADHLRYAFLGLLAWVAIIVADGDFWSPWQQNRAGTLLGHVLAGAVALPFGAFVLLGVLRLAGRSVRIADTLRALAVVMAASLAADVLPLALYYALPLPLLGTLESLIGTALAVWAIVYLAGLRRRGARGWFRMAWGATALAVLAGLQYTTSLAQRRAGMPAAVHTVQPPLFGMAGPRTALEGYLADVEAEAARRASKAAEVQVRHAAARQKERRAPPE